MKWWLSFLFLVFCEVALGQCCSGGVPMSSNVGLPANETRVLQVLASYDWNNLQTLKAENQTLDDDARQRETHTVFIQAGYGFNEQWSLDVFLPWVRQERTVFAENGTREMTHSEGLGDVVILPKYKIHKNWTTGVGWKLPTGQANQTNEGILLNADLQPGSGSHDLLIHTAFMKSGVQNPAATFFGSMLIILKGTNSNYLGNSSYKFGDEILAKAGMSTRLLAGGLMLDPSVTLTSRLVGEDRFDGSPFPASGGEFVFLDVGLGLLVTKSISWLSKVSLPIYARVNDSQLVPTLRLQTGLLLKLNLDPKNPFQ